MLETSLDTSLETPSEILVRRTADLLGQADAKGRLYQVTGMYPGEPKRWKTHVDQLPVIVIPVIAEYSPGHEASHEMTAAAAGTLALRLYNLTRYPIDVRDLDIRELPARSQGIWYATRCSASGVTFYVQRPLPSLKEAKLHIRGIFRQETRNGYAAGVSASDLAARIWLT